jgi:hypothetical protein
VGLIHFLELEVVEPDAAAPAPADINHQFPDLFLD